MTLIFSAGPEDQLSWLVSCCLRLSGLIPWAWALPHLLNQGEEHVQCLHLSCDLGAVTRHRIKQMLFSLRGTICVCVSQIFTPHLFDKLLTSQIADKGYDSIAVLFSNHDKFCFFTNNISIPLSLFLCLLSLLLINET